MLTLTLPWRNQEGEEFGLEGYTTDSNVVLSSAVARTAVVTGAAAGMAASGLQKTSISCQSRGRKTSVGVGIPGIVASASISLLHHHLLFFSAPHEQQQKSGKDEEYDVHDAERERGLQHGACLIHRERERVIAADPARRQRNVEILGVGEVGAVGFGNVAQFVHACNQRARKAQVDEGDEEGRSACGFSSEQGGNRPDGAQNRGYEENSVGNVSC